MKRASVVVAMVLGCAPRASQVDVRELPLPSAFERGSSAQSSIALVDWRAYFADDHLNAVIAAAIGGNLDLQIALQRIEIARATVRGASGALLPQVSAFAGAGVSRYGLYTIEGSGNASTEITPGRITPNPVGELAIGLQASWEVDAWGKLRALRGSARTRYLASIDGASLVISNLVAGVATTYFDLVALDHVRSTLQETIARQTQALDMIRAQKEAGRANELAVQQFEAQLASSQAMDMAALQQTRELENQLNVLLGRFPQPIVRTKELLQRPVAASLATGVPAELLRNRPDVREAELHVQAARFDLAAARAAFYPTLGITADIGYRAFDPRYLVSTPESLVSSIAAGILAPLVNRRAIEADFRVAEATRLQALFEYQRVVLISFAEVATGVSALEQAAQVVEQRKRKKAAVAGTVDAADALFRAGKATYLEVLLAQQNTLEADLELIGALRDQHVAGVRLYKALGGGWRGVLDARPLAKR